MNTPRFLKKLICLAVTTFGSMSTPLIAEDSTKVVPSKIPLNPLPAADQKRPDEATMKIFQKAADLRKREKYRDAEALLTKAIANGNDHVVLHMSLATTHALQQKFKEASNSYQIAWSRTGSIGMLEGYAVALTQIKDLERLRKITEDLIDNYDKLKEGRFALLMVVIADKNRELFDRAIVKIPAQDIRENPKLASMLALTSQNLAKDRLQKE